MTTYDNTRDTPKIGDDIGYLDNVSQDVCIWDGREVIGGREFLIPGKVVGIADDGEDIHVAMEGTIVTTSPAFVLLVYRPENKRTGIRLGGTSLRPNALG
jgi:hypothetical protein